MTNPLLYDIKKTFLSKSVLISMTVLILFSLTLIPSFTLTTTTGVNSANTQVLNYYDASGYHFLAFVWNQYGQPVSGVTFQANVSTPALHEGSGTTNASGIAQFVVPVPENGTYPIGVKEIQANSYSFGFTSGYSPFRTFHNGTQGVVPPGEVVSAGFGPSNGVSAVTDSSNPSQNKLLINWAGPFGAAPESYSVYYRFQNGTSPNCSSSGNGVVCTQVSYVSSTPMNESNSRFLGNVSGFLQILNLPKLPLNVTANSGVLTVGLFSPNGTHITDIGSSLGYFYPQVQQLTPYQGNSFVVSFLEGLFGLLIPLIAIIGSYNAYGKDRVSGVLESVLAQPVSRRGLAISRFFSTFVPMAAAISISLAFIDAIDWYYTKSFIAASIILSSAGAFFVELAAFIGVMMLLSHFTKSSGVLIGFGIMLFIIVDFFWGVIISIVGYLVGVQYGSAEYLKIEVAGEFVNPAQFVGLVVTYLTHAASSAGLGSGGGTPITPSMYGITIPTIVVTGLFWAIVPLAVFLYRAVKKD